MINPLDYLAYPGDVVRGLMAGRPGERVSGAELTGDPYSGFAADIATDPLTLLTLGGATALSPTARRLGAGLAGMPGEVAMGMMGMGMASGAGRAGERAAMRDKIFGALRPFEEAGNKLDFLEGYPSHQPLADLQEMLWNMNNAVLTGRVPTMASISRIDPAIASARGIDVTTANSPLEELFSQATNRGNREALAMARRGAREIMPMLEEYRAMRNPLSRLVEP